MTRSARAARRRPRLTRPRAGGGTGRRRQASLRELKLNSWTVLDDLHEGRDSGGAWSWIIDVSAVVMAVSALTGLWLLFHVRRRRDPGLLVAGIGSLVLVAVAWIWTP